MPLGKVGEGDVLEISAKRTSKGRTTHKCKLQILALPLMALGPWASVTLHPTLSFFAYRIALAESRNSYPVGQLTK